MSPSSAATVVVVPCYNEAQRLDRRAFDVFLRQCNDVSLLLVDDGSTDDTPRVLEELRAEHSQQITVLRLERNGGKGEAVRQGLLAALQAAPTFVGYWDADLATPLEAIPQFRALLVERPELTLVIGSRVRLLGRQIERRWIRHVVGRVFATAASNVLGLNVYDTQCGAKLFRVTPETADLFRTPFRSRWVFDVEILARMVAASRGAGERPADEMIYEFPLDRWQDVRGSRLRLRDFAVAAADMAAIFWRYTLGRGKRS